MLNFTTGHFQDFRSFNGVYALSGLNNELTISVSNALMETSEVCHQICPVENAELKKLKRRCNYGKHQNEKGRYRHFDGWWRCSWTKSGH
jgi:hypothetical protein